MVRTIYFRLFASMWLGILFVWVIGYMSTLTEVMEPTFEAPIQHANKPWELREDRMGKGHFGASRGGGKRSHKGIDVLASIDDPIRASKSGRVSYAAKRGNYGLFVELKHHSGFVTRYAHLNAIAVRVGDWVKQGETIGLVGKTGNANAPSIKPHVHFEIRQGGAALNPEIALTRVRSISVS